jgi:hypothetical protein
VNAVAPFKFDYIHPKITIYEREDFQYEKLLEKCIEFNAEFLYLGGWAYKPYIQLVKTIKVKNSIIGFDNQYNGSLKQLVGSIYFRIKLKPYFKGAFVPGIRQELFAKKLGFKTNLIAQGAYCCDTNLFAKYYIEKEVKKNWL